MKTRRLAVLVFVIGFCIVIYPMIAKVYYNYSAVKESNILLETFNVNDELQKKQYEMFVDTNEALKNGQSIEAPPVKSLQEDAPLPKNEIKNGTIGTIEIPKLKIHYPIYKEATPESLDIGVSRVSGTSYPVGGKNTNSVLAAHSYSPYQEWFTHIDQLKNNDKIIINNFKEKLYYKVVGSEVVYPDQTEVLRVRKGKDMVTLITCTPDGSMRVIIYAERTDKDGEKIEPVEKKTIKYRNKTIFEKMKILSQSWWIILIIILLTSAFMWRLKKTNKKL